MPKAFGEERTADFPTPYRGQREGRKDTSDRGRGGKRKRRHSGRRRK